MKVAVVGAGIFGVAAAIELARAGARVDLFDARHEILTGATARCQARLHRGYHYPRSEATALTARHAFFDFADRFRAAVWPAPNHFYAIAAGGKTTPDEYLDFCDRMDLPCEVVDRPRQLHTADLVVRVAEAFVDVDALRRQLRAELASADVTVLLGIPVEPGPMHGYDWTVRATYGQPWPQPLRYEVCELAIAEFGRYEGDSYVVLDGDFVSLDPWGRQYALYDVSHSVHWAGDRLDLIPAEFAELVARPGLVRTPLSHFADMCDSASRFLRGLQPAGQGVSIYHGSLFSVRAVLPDVDSTDERPTLVEAAGNVISILSGKICTAPAAAKSVAATVFGLVPA